MSKKYIKYEIFNYLAQNKKGKEEAQKYNPTS